MVFKNISTREAASLLGVTARRVRQCIHEGVLDATQLGHGHRSTFLVSRHSVLRLRRKRNARAQQKAR